MTYNRTINEYEAGAAQCNALVSLLAEGFKYRHAEHRPGDRERECHIVLERLPRAGYAHRCAVIHPSGRVSRWTQAVSP